MMTDLMPGLMTRDELSIASLLKHAERHHGDQWVVSRRVEGDLHRYTYRDLARRSRQLAKALAALGTRENDRIATLAWNGYRHLELYYAVSGSARILHTINPRLHPDQIAWIANDAGDRVLCFETTFLPIIEAIADRLTGIEHLVVLADREHMPQSKLPLLCYEELVAAQDDRFEWPRFTEDAAATLCYTSGTTGNPKGVLYSHRSTLLHTFAVALPDSLSMSSQEVCLPVVPMFHVNAWGLPYAACMTGAKLVLPGPRLDGPSLHALFEEEGVTVATGVPTVWQGLIDHVAQNGLAFSTLKRLVVGGAACSPALLAAFESRGVNVRHGWGMTETSPVGTASVLKGAMLSWTEAERHAVQLRQGRALFGVDLKIVDDTGAELAWDGKRPGHLMVRGHWVLSRYYGQEQSALEDGWFATGDIATIDADGFMQITDRSKDVIKSGGEWISSIDIENIAISHPAVAGAACIGVAHPKWGERPLLVVQLRAGMLANYASLRALYEGRVANWWIPDDAVFVEALPLGATGKILKTNLRDRFGAHYAGHA